MRNEAAIPQEQSLAFATAKALGALAWFFRSWYPPSHFYFQERMRDYYSRLVEARNSSPSLHKSVISAADLALTAFTHLLNAPENASEAVFSHILRAYRCSCQAEEAFFAARTVIPESDRYFRESATTKGDGEVIHFGVSEDSYARGAITLFQPTDAASPLPLILVLHGGGGHGRDILWTWVREARSRGFIVAAPTSQESTWNLLEPEREAEALHAALEIVCDHCHVDTNRILITGVSDGGTCALGQMLIAGSPFTAAAVAACTLPPLDTRPVRGRRILWLHGCMDWMFSHERAEREAQLLWVGGAAITFLTIPDLAHAWPRDQNGMVLDWFMGG